ncbi:MAG: tRNA pseudouridine(13) synthase TruD [bacterium]
MSLPFATPALPGTGGRIGPGPEDFRVQEIPAYSPQGEGAHCFVRIRKTGITSFEAVARLARAVGIRPGDIGMAGIKDRHAVAEQWLSLPDARPDEVLALELPDLEVLEAALHPQKLRTGHLRGNRFRIRLVECRAEDALDRATRVLAQLVRTGFYHFFGPQRFGRDGRNAELGRALLAGGPPPRDRRTRRLVLSALQSELFNDYLVERCQAAPLDRPLAGEIVQRTDSGGLFEASDLEEVGDRMAAGAVVPTGPLFGPKLKRAPEGSSPWALEERVLARSGLQLSDFQRFRKLAPGGRRPLVVRPTEVAASADEDTVRVQFTLPPGAYATVLLRELTKTPDAALRPAVEPG